MLVLTRKAGEQIRIGSDITITVLLTGRSKVKLGISGPADVRVLRAELAALIAAGDSPPPEPSMRAGAAGLPRRACSAAP